MYQFQNCQSDRNEQMLDCWGINGEKLLSYIHNSTSEFGKQLLAVFAKDENNHKWEYGIECLGILSRKKYRFKIGRKQLGEHIWDVRDTIVIEEDLDYWGCLSDKITTNEISNPC